ncbi:MAG: hypothetical protein ACT4OJ_00180 [Bacteroidota bacterium]
MNPRINQLVKSLLKKDTLEQCSLPELEQFAERHPYFGAAQLLLTKKMQTDHPEKYDEQLQKTFLFFHNPLWVEHLLNDTGKAEIIRAKKEEPQPEVMVSNPAAEPLISENKETINEPAPVMAVTVIAEPPVSEPPPAGVSALKIEAAPVKDELLFEPFHTVDYFASQGIKLKEEEQPKDKFGQQLKSFTEWLKTMKRLPATEIAKTSEPVVEKKVEEMAEHSLEDREVVTEAMAEVWEKQGNAIKAIDIYSKLSLLEPSKSVYFAAKIEELKKLN